MQKLELKPNEKIIAASIEMVHQHKVHMNKFGMASGGKTMFWATSDKKSLYKVNAK